MRQALTCFWESAKTFWDELIVLVPANLFWFLLCLPGVTMPAATAGLNLLANELAHGRRAPLSLFWVGFRQYFWPALGVGLVNLLLAVVIATNYLFYRQIPAAWAGWIGAAWLAAGIFWAALQPFLFPLLMEQIPRNVLLPFRNGLYLILATPVVAASALILCALTLGLSLALVLPLLAGGPALIALFANRLTVAKLQDFKRLRESEVEPGESPAAEPEAGTHTPDRG